MQMTRILTAALILTGSSLAQTAKWPDIGVFGGYQGWGLWHTKFGDRPGGELTKGTVLGVRSGYEFSPHLGVETAYMHGYNNLRLFPDQSGPARPDNIELGARNRHLSLNALWHFTGPQSKLRPYLTAGMGAIWFKPTDDALREAHLPANDALGAQGLKTNLMPAFNWGGGVKYNLTSLLQLRFDMRNIITLQPHFGMPPNNLIPGSVFVSPGGVASGLQATAGVGFNFNKAAPPAPRPSRKSKTLRVTLSGGTTPIQPTGSVKFTASTDAPDPSTVKYAWTVNAMGTDATGSEFTFFGKGREPGDYKICGTATTTLRDWEPGSECYTVTVEALPRLNVNISEPVRINTGETTRFTATSDAPAGETVTYEWALNGQKVNGSGPTYTFNSDGRQAAVYEVCVTATARGVTSQKQCSSANVVPCTAPTISISALPSSEVFAGERISIPVVTQPGSCKSPVRVSYRAGDGVISADGTLDTTNVAFDRTNRSKLQRRSVPVTATATDEKGATASAQTSIIVKLAPAAQRLDDVLFASRNARVNNCGKRVLLELLTPRLRDDPEARVVLIGHIDESESGKSAAPARKKGSRRAVAPARPLDKARVLNAAAVISGGEGICPGLELSRIKVGYAGKVQGGAALRPTFCGSSTEIQSTKRAGAKADARAPYRRVEVWIVPNGAEMPPGVTIQDAPEAEIKVLKCPK